MSQHERLPVIYIAGAYRAKTPWQILGNIRLAQEAALQVWKLGAVALCPHGNTALFDGEADDQVWLQGDLELLRRCDALLALPSCHVSQGAQAEIVFATDVGLPVFVYDAFVEGSLMMKFKRWIDGWKDARRIEAQRAADTQFGL